MQSTLKKSVTLQGVALHSGRMVTMKLLPAGADHGVVFKRTDISDINTIIPALYDRVVDAQLCTVIANDAGISVATIEHIMAALRGCGIDNVLIEIDGPEVPILDGSSKPFIDAFDSVGLQMQSIPRRAIRILKEVSYIEGNKTVTLSPSPVPVYGGMIDYADTVIGKQSYEVTLVNGNFRHDVADCRTFCLLKDVEMMQKNGLALGGSLDNAVVIDETIILNEEGLRCQDEFIRHKILDAVGDLALCGGVFLGRYQGERAGHAMNNKALRALMADQNAWEVIDLYVDLTEADRHPYHVTASQQVSANV